MKFLWLTPRWPFPADDGAKQASIALLLALADAGHEIDIVTFAREKAILLPEHPGIRMVAHFRASSLAPLSRVIQALRNLASSLPFSVAPFVGFGLSWDSLRAKLSGEPAAVVFDGAHAYASFVGWPAPWPILYRAHNLETSLWEQAAVRVFFLMRPYFRLQAKRMRKFEEELARVALGIAAISPEETDVFRAWVPSTKVEWVPMGFRFSQPIPPPEEPITFGFLGRVDWPPNREGLAWFLKNVWPEVKTRRPEARLIVAGSGESAWLKEFVLPGVEWRGRIDAVEPFYKEIHAALAPLFFGSGTKIKLVEAARFGRPVFATPQAYEGSGISRSAMALISPDRGEWVNALCSSEAVELGRIGERAFTEASRIFDSSAAARRFLSLLS